MVRIHSSELPEVYKRKSEESHSQYPHQLPSTSEHTIEDDYEELGLVRNLSLNHPSTITPLSPLEKWCMDMYKAHQVVPGSSWGSLPLTARGEWKGKNCDHVVEKRDTVASSSLPSDPGEQKALCLNWHKQYKVEGMNLKNLPQKLKVPWRHLHCSMKVWDQRYATIPLSSCYGENANNNNNNIDPEDESYEMISLLVAVTTRKMHHPAIENLAIFHALLPSFIRTLDCGFKYSVVIGYDKGDQYFDKKEKREEVDVWFLKEVEQPLLERGISVKLFFREVNNVQKKPGPVFNEMAREAYNNPKIKADFFFRVNDDSEILQTWPRHYTNALKALSPPLVGVVGPLCKQGNTRILTHDFTSRVHMYIFEENYYPPPLSDWWMDDWISLVYGSQRTFRTKKIEIVHHTGAHATRYEVDQGHAKLLPNLVNNGKTKIANYMRKKKDVSEKTVSGFLNDRFNGPPFKDIPYQARRK